MIRSTPARAFAAVLLVLALGGVVSGCSTAPSASTAANAPVPSATAPSGPPSGAVVAVPTIKVLAPVDGTSIGSDVAVRVETTGLKFVNPSNTTVPGEGHVHFTLDDQPVQMSVSPDYTFKGVAPGAHTLRAELVQNNTDPFAPAVYKTVEFTVE